MLSQTRSPADTDGPASHGRGLSEVEMQCTIRRMYALQSGRRYVPTKHVIRGRPHTSMVRELQKRSRCVTSPLCRMPRRENEARKVEVHRAETNRCHGECVDHTCCFVRAYARHSLVIKYRYTVNVYLTHHAYGIGICGFFQSQTEIVSSVFHASCAIEATFTLWQIGSIVVY